MVLLARTTRSVSLTDAGRRLVDGAGPGAGPGARGPRQRLGATRERRWVGCGCRCRGWRCPSSSLRCSPAFRARHPRVEVEVVVEERFVDIVAEGYDAGVRLSEAIERDMVQVRLTDAFRFVVVGAPSYLARHGTPRKPEDLLRHECITFRSQTTGALYAWELERGRRNWRVPVRGGVVTSDGRLMRARWRTGARARVRLRAGWCVEQLRTGRLKRGARALRADRSRLLPLLPQPSPALGAAAALRRSGQGAGRAWGEVIGWPRGMALSAAERPSGAGNDDGVTGPTLAYRSGAVTARCS